MPTENASRFEHIPLVRSIAASLSNQSIHT